MILFRQSKVFINFKQALFSKTYIRRYLGTQVNHDFKDDDFLKLDISGETLKFPYVWLRDNCQCEECFHCTVKSRILDWSKFNVDIKPKDVIKDENSTQVTWEDGHISKFADKWLKIRSFTTKDQKVYNEIIYKPTKIPWNNENFDNIFTKPDYNELLENDQVLLKWLNNLSIYGVTLIKNAPKTETALEYIIEKIGFRKRTHYGSQFVIQHSPNSSNIAYLSSNLQMHTDIPYYENTAGVIFLHCLTQTDGEGGENLLADCQFIANYMKQHHPEQYKLLTTTEIEWSDIGSDGGNSFFKLYRSPVICVDKNGDVIRMNFSIPQRGNHFPGPIESVKPWYEAYSLLFNLSMKLAARFKTNPGDILVFDNTRLMHGRSKYQNSPDNVRKLIGVYVDWDEVYSRLRCLKVKLEDDKFYESI